MFKIKPLNRESISDDDGPVIRKEAQEENALAKYNKALKLQCSNELDEAEELILQLLEDDIPEIEQRGGLPKTMSTFKYSCYLNIGKIYSTKGENQKALDYYLDASKLDKTDVTLWFKIGTLALELDHFRQAAYALSQGLECNKNHWPTLDKLITLLYAMRDSVSCLWYISHALQLDPEYTRGLMLRKKIYERNPGTKDYYRLFNPDCIYDPPLNTPFDEDEGNELEIESIKIFNRIREIEKDFEPKPLPVLSFNKPLEQFTWVALGESLIDMHNYIAENKMSFISRIDLNKSINIKNRIDIVHRPSTETKVKDNDANTDNAIDANDCNKTDLEEQEERRLTPEPDMPGIEDEDVVMETDKEENADENIDEIKNTSMTEVPSEQNDCEERKSENENTETKDCVESAESTTEKTTTNDEKIKTKSSNRRRRNSLSFLQPWAWHAKRKSNRKLGKNDKDDSIEGTLKRIIPNSLLPNGLKTDRYKQFHSMQQDDSLSTMDLYKMYMNEEQENTTSEPDIVKNCDNQLYFGTKQENEDVEAFWNYNFESCDIMFMLEKYVFSLANKWELKWPTKLKAIYIEAYNMFREHFDHIPTFAQDVEFSEIEKDVEATLLYGELLYDAMLNSLVTKKTFPCTSMVMLELALTKKTSWGDKYLKMCLRLYWLKANILMNENSNDLAIQSLNSIIYFILNSEEDGDKFYLHLPNCISNSVITLHNTEKLLKSFEMIQSLTIVESLFENKNYLEVIRILKDTFNYKTNTRFKTKIDRPVQIFMFLHSLWLTDQEECFKWSEVCLNESLPLYLKTCAQPDSTEHKRWTLVVVKCLVIMEACVKENTVIIIDSIREHQVRVVENLTGIICHQINSKSMDNKMPLETVKPWILLHYILQREEHRVQARRRVRHSKSIDDSDDEQNETQKSDESEEDEDKDVPPSIQILFMAHEFLGKKSWCLENSGELLLFMIDVVLYRLNAPIFEGIREKIDIHLEQAFFCLFQHPSKKNKVSRHLADHNVNPLSLTWEYAQQLYEFYQPKALPEFDSYRYSSITNEMEQLLLRILALVPSDYDPQHLVPKINDFINGQSESLPEPINFPDKVSAIYYLLGDYYLKLHDPIKGQKYFVLDLCVNPSRLDTWADLALGMASQLEKKLNHCEFFKNECEFLDKAKSAQICFKQSLYLSDGHAMLWIEYGNFVYMAHSFCSRLLKGDTETFSMEKFESLENQKESLLDSAAECFTAANLAWIANENEHDERWLHHYMLGKISEKRKQEPAIYLEHYFKAGKLLFENKATYPLKINYSNPQHLSMEALEIHYRIHASILKYLELHEDKPLSRALGRTFQKYLRESNNGLFSNPNTVNSTETTKTSGTKRPNSDADEEAAGIKRRRLSELTIFEDVANIVEDMLKIIESETTQQNEDDDVVMIIDSDDDTTNNKRLEAYKQLSKRVQESKNATSTSTTDQEKPRLSVKNVQDIMDDMMKKCMANQPEYKSEPDTDFEVEIDKIKEVKPAASENNQTKQTDLPSSPSRRGSTTSTAATTTSTSDSSSSSSSSESSDDSSSSDSESSETEDSKSNSGKKKTEKDDTIMTQEEIKKLIDQCLYSLEQCVSRFPQNYKAIYRLTHFYLNNKTYKDLSKCRQLMLMEYNCADNSVISGLFSDRKANNFFNGVWRIPTSEIDRPGSFASHMSRCVQLLMQVLRQTDDHKILLDLCLTLKKTPDPDKIYIRDSERQQLSDQALSLCIQTIKCILKKIADGKEIYQENEPNQAGQETNPQAKFVLDVYRDYIKVQKYLSQKESVFSALLIDSYKAFMQNKLPENANILDLAAKFCQQRKAANRLAMQQANANKAAVQAASQAASQTTTPSATTQNTLPTSPTVPLQRKTAKGLPGRPRGRPPNINKHLSGTKLPKSSKDPFLTPSNPYSWQSLLYQQAMSGTMDPNAALNFMMKKYQEELLRQYAMGSQNALMSNPFAMKNPLISSSGLTSTSFTNPVTTKASTLAAASKLLTSVSSATKPSSSKSGISSVLKVLKTPPIPLAKPVSTNQSLLKTVNQGKPSGMPKVSNPVPSNIKPTNPLSSSPLQLNVKSTNPISKSTNLQSSKTLNFSSSSNKPANITTMSNKTSNLPISSKSLPSKPSLPLKSDKKDDSKLRYSKESNKTYYAEPTSNINIFKDRPGISITPISQSPLQKPPMPTSPGKTLQQKLAERQKQNPVLQQQKIKNPIKHDIPDFQMNYSPKTYSKQNTPAPAHSSSYPKPSTTIPNFTKPIPSSLTITKSLSPSANIMQGLHTGDSGISISPLASPSFSKSDMNPMMNFRKPPVPKLKMGRKLGSEITVTPNYSKPTYIDDPKMNFPPNIPMSLSVVKKDNKPEQKPSNDTIEIITIE